MAKFEVLMPKMGESIEEATITNWFVKEGDKVVEDDVLLEIATDKVDSEIPSPVEGTVKKIMYEQDETVAVGSVIAVIDLGGDDSDEEEDAKQETNNAKHPVSERPTDVISNDKKPEDTDRFYSPLVRKIAWEEGIDSSELSAVPGSGLSGRVQKRDIMKYLEQREQVGSDVQGSSYGQKQEKAVSADSGTVKKAPVSVSAGDEIIQMSRMRKLIADHMIHSVQTSAHVTNMLEVDVTDIVNWRNSVKEDFLAREGVKLTYLPVLLEAAVRGLKDYPMINSSVDGDQIIVRKNINLGIAVALPDNNLIVPVIRNADNYNLSGLTKEINRLAQSARSNSLNPDDIQGGTFTVTNFGTFKNTIGTPIINQPQVAILAIGSIEKKPAVLETPQGDVIAIRHKMFLSLTYDHRIIDGALGGSYLRKVGDYIEGFDPNRIV